MAISRKPKTQQTPASPVDIEALIAKGGSVAQGVGDSTESLEGSRNGDDAGKQTVSFTMRVPQEILHTLDAHRTKQPYKVPRQQWILEAMLQRLEREMLPATSSKDDRTG